MFEIEQNLYTLQTLGMRSPLRKSSSTCDEMKNVEAGHPPTTKRNLWTWKQVKLSQNSFAIDMFLHFINNHWKYIVYPETVLVLITC